MAELFDYLDKLRHGSEYLDRSSFSTLTEQKLAKDRSFTVYVGNLSFFTSESQLYFLFSMAGFVDRVVMGLHRTERTPCGFAFVMFYNRDGVVNASKFLNGMVVDGKKMKVEVDPGFKEGRQYGRARSGGQMQDERRSYADPQRTAPKRMRFD